MPSGHWAVPFRMFGLTENGKRNAATGRFFVRWLLYAGKARQWTGGRLPSGGNAAGMRYGRRVPAGKARHPAGGLAGAGPRTGDAVEWEGRPPSGRLYAGAVLGRHGAMCLDGAGGARAVKRPPSCRALAGAGVCAGRRAAGVGKQAFRGCAWGLATCNVLAWGTRAPKTGRLLLGARAGVSLRAWEMCVFQGRAWGLATCNVLAWGHKGTENWPPAAGRPRGRIAAGMGNVRFSGPRMGLGVHRWMCLFGRHGWCKGAKNVPRAAPARAASTRGVCLCAQGVCFFGEVRGACWRAMCLDGTGSRQDDVVRRYTAAQPGGLACSRWHGAGFA